MILLLLLAQDWNDVAWEPNDGWSIRDGLIERVAKAGTLWSKEAYGDFVLRLQYKLPVGGNSGVLFRGRNNVEHQIELLGNHGGPVSTGCTGSIFRRRAPASNPSRKPGEWNEMELEVRGRAVTLTFNGVAVHERAVVDDLPWRGPVGLQEHGTPLWFRNVKIRRLDADRPAWATTSPEPLSADETRAFMQSLARNVFDRHLKKAEGSEQRGMVYEYFDTAKRLWVQGEALDTMHDGAWFSTALASASRATGDPFYDEVLTGWTLPFYLKMLNRSDVLFSTAKEDLAPDGKPFDRERRLQDGEKGFVPYFWDDGASVSLETVRRKTGRPPYPCTDRLSDKPNPEMKLDGWSHGTSNHMAQDLAVMLQATWRHLRDKDPALAAEIAEAARNLHASRTRHGSPNIDSCLAAAGLTSGDRRLLDRIRMEEAKGPSNHYTRALAEGGALPAYVDEQAFAYYAAIAKTGGAPPKELAFRLIYDAFTLPQLVRWVHDERPLPPGLNTFDLGVKPAFRDGKPESRGGPMGSRVGPQLMVVAGWALQLLEAYPGIWEPRLKADELRVRVLPEGRTYTINAKAEGGASDAVVLGPATLQLVGCRDGILVAGRSTGERVTVRLGADRGWADVTLHRERRWEAVSDRGQPLRVTGHVERTDDGFAFEFALPYSVVRDQPPWANGIEHGRCTVAVGDARRAYVLSTDEADVKAALRRELGAGLRTWKAIFDEKGCIPTGIGRWDAYSDAGGHAHVIQAGAQWLHVLAGRKDWAP